MKYFPFHWGDWCASTCHLTDAEKLQLLAMIGRYYRDERPFPADVAAAGRLVGARTPEQLQIVEALLAEFFVLADDGWHQRRADREIAACQAAAAKGRAGARARWEQPDLVGELSTDAPGNATQDPEPKTQKAATPRAVNKSRKVKASPALAEAARSVCDTLAAVGMHDVNPDDPLLHELLDAGTPAQAFMDAALKAGHADHPFRYTLKTVRGKLEEEQKPRPSPQYELLTLYGHTVVDAGTKECARTQEYLRTLELSDEQKAATMATARRIREGLSLGTKTKKKEAAHAC